MNLQVWVGRRPVPIILSLHASGCSVLSFRGRSSKIAETVGEDKGTTVCHIPLGRLVYHADNMET